MHNRRRRRREENKKCECNVAGYSYAIFVADAAADDDDVAGAVNAASVDGKCILNIFDALVRIFGCPVSL